MYDVYQEKMPKAVLQTKSKAQMKAIWLKLPVKGPLQEIRLLNITLFGFIFMSDVELYSVHFLNMTGFDFQLIWTRLSAGD